MQLLLAYAFKYKIAYSTFTASESGRCCSGLCKSMQTISFRILLVAEVFYLCEVLGPLPHKLFSQYYLHYAILSCPIVDLAFFIIK